MKEGMPSTVPAGGGLKSRPSAGSITDRVKRLVSQIFRAPPAASIETAPAPTIGRSGEPLRVLAFAGGGLDTVMQLGVAHALLVTKSKPPDVVSGVSMGAVNAVALAEIMQAGSKRLNIESTTAAGSLTDKSPRVDRVAQVSRFREYFEDVLNAPGELLTNGLPDPFEINAHAPLKPQELPIHNQEERYERTLAAAARFGLVRLFNGVLSIKISIAALTVAVRRCLEVRRLSNTERRIWLRFLLQAREIFGLWWLLSQRVVVLSPLLSRVLLGVCFGGSYRALSRLEQKTARGEALSPVDKLRRWILEWCMKIFGFRRADTAKQIITRGVIRRALHRLVQFTLGGVCWLWLNFPLVLLIVWVLTFAFYRGKRAATTHTLLWWSALGYIVSLVIVVLIFKWKIGSIMGRLLASFDLEADLLTPFILKPLLVRFFDRNYYGKLDFNEVLNAALHGQSGEPSNGTGGHGKRLRHYLENADMPIYVAPAVANIGEVSNLAQLEVAGLNERVIDALLAACAVTPFYRAQVLNQTASDAAPGNPNYYIDAGNLSNDPSFVILRQLRRVYSARLPTLSTRKPLEDHGKREDILLADGLTAIEIYPVAPFPVSIGHLSAGSNAAEPQGGRDSKVRCKTYSGLLEAALRAIHLQRFQDATLERKLISLYNRAIPRGHTFYEYEVPLADGRVVQRVAASATVRAIEVDHALNLNVRILGTRNKDDRREMISRAVAEGCRAAVQQLIPTSIRLALQNDVSKSSPDGTVSCRRAVLERLVCEDLLPGSPTEGGPGLQEVCKYCCLNHGAKEPTRPELPQALSVPSPASSPEVADWPVWPAPGQPQAPGPANLPSPSAVRERSHAVPLPTPGSEGLAWPRKVGTSSEPGTEAQSDPERPTVSLLFSGGVFRGVFQLGVVNALNEAGIRPDLLAGASVGTITAAMVGSVFTQQDQRNRHAQLAKLAGVFLAIDRLILTDRFADFVRHITLRAADARFSLCDADRFFRRFDKGQLGKFCGRGRRVAAGLERLFNLSPFSLVELTKAVRNGDAAKAWEQFTRHVENFLDRNGVGQEILGAEPLALLIQELVMPAVGAANSESAEFDIFLQKGGLHMLATTTNLSQGKLEVLSSLPDDPASRVLLREGLLASSAFPAVFRPRWSWEVYPRAETNDKLIDGGVMDNLPVDAVVSFLWRAQKRGLIKLWPKSAPHLLFTASLQVRQGALQGEQLRRTAHDWRRLQARAKRLSYNQKIDRFAEIQRNLRAIARQRSGSDDPPVDWNLLNIEAVVVKPEWLVGTFAFNPMLGFCRPLQAASIAHGCAATLAELQKRQKAGYSGWLTHWGVNPEFEVHADTHRDGFLTPLKRTRAQRNKGECWFRKGVTCPFSRDYVTQNRLLSGLDFESAAELDQIYQLCGDPITHRPKAFEQL